MPKEMDRVGLHDAHKGRDGVIEKCATNNPRGDRP